MKMKYLILQNDRAEAPVVFSQLLSHHDIAGGKSVCSAGFCELDEDGRWMAYGQSTSLNVRSRPQDAQILNRHLPMRACEPLAPDFAR